MSLTAEITALFERRGAGSYFGEKVSMLEHALQAAHFARAEQASPALVVAALLHDVGHLLEDVPEDINDWKVDARHEAVGGAWLARHFGPEVWEPVELHVAAKRYLCATRDGYFEALSADSRRSLVLQGGMFTPEEAKAFIAQPHAEDAVRLRLWDDLAKVENAATPPLAHFVAAIEAAQRPATAAVASSLP
jgi:phosphonate degradation associated HDIG domain protein